MRTSPLRRSGVDHTVLPANTPHLPSPRNRSPEGATAVCSNSSHLIAAYYSFIDPEMMKYWVGLVSWPTADGLPKWLPISCSLGTDQRKFTSQRPAFYHWAMPLAQEYSIVVSPRHPFNILVQKVKGQGHSVTKCKTILKAIEWPAWVLHSIECPASVNIIMHACHT